MKKYFTKKRGRTFLVLVLAAMMIASFSAAAFALSPGETASYSMLYGRGIAIFTVSKNGVDYWGLCSDPEGACALNGTATVRDALDQNSKYLTTM